MAIYPRIKQGGSRSLPDGFLHLNNYSHSLRSGMAGVMFERVFTPQQRETVCELLRELATEEMARSVDFKQLFHFKHGVYRFEKDFLDQNFKGMVYGYMKLVHKSASALMAMAVTGEIIELYQNNGIPKVRFK